ncbi:MAG TPA: hypothetical protein VN408_41035 [Actinoplanes sp.]|nr:hypothetical protein [Actinoplanes sp.]
MTRGRRAAVRTEAGLLVLWDAVPAGTIPPGSVPARGVSPGSVPAGGVSPGSVPAGGVSPGSVPAGGVPSGEIHLAVATVDEWISDVVERSDPDLGKQWLIGALRSGAVEHDTGLVPGWTARTDKYPDELATAMVRAHLTFRSARQRRVMLDRGDLFPLTQDRLDTVRNVTLVLFGLNRMWVPQLSGLSALAESLPLAPAGLPARLDALLTATPASAVPAADALISETLILIARHLPDAGAATALGRLSAG